MTLRVHLPEGVVEMTPAEYIELFVDVASSPSPVSPTRGAEGLDGAAGSVQSETRVRELSRVLPAIHP